MVTFTRGMVYARYVHYNTSTNVHSDKSALYTQYTIELNISGFDSSSRNLIGLIVLVISMTPWVLVVSIRLNCLGHVEELV